ncbi:hypothetical protein LJR219_003138 [Phenylobacterium sp. LjRoot219]|uniref:hypothetical protein n=1 Tax=Phenylobacterium sp. LjRoot219 TaxID=3342283 RepID=UPI003ED0C497
MSMEAGFEHREHSAFGWLERIWDRAGQLAPMLSSGLPRRPLTAAGFAAGASLLLGAAFALRGRPAQSPDQTSEEIIARALCREDPETPTHRGPLWTGYRKDARRVLAALREAGLLVGPTGPTPQ